MHVAVEEVSEGQRDLTVLFVRYVLTVGILNAQEELEVEQVAQFWLEDKLDFLLALRLVLCGRWLAGGDK